MDQQPSAQNVFFVGAAGALRRAAGAPRQIVCVAGTSKKIQEGGGDCSQLLYICVQVQAGQPAPLVARFRVNGDPGNESLQHNFVVKPLFEQVITESETFYVQCELATTLLVQVVAFK